MQQAVTIGRHAAATVAALLLLNAALPIITFSEGRLPVPVTGGISCYECNVFRGETGQRVQCQEFIEDPVAKTKNWIIVPIARIPITKKTCKACGTYVTWSENHHRKPRGGDESQVTMVISRFCMEGDVDKRFWNGACVDNLGSHSYLRRCFCFTDNCNSYENWSMTKFGP